MQALQMGIEVKMRAITQTVQFIMQLSAPIKDVKWYKEANEVTSGGKYRIFYEDDGLKHVLELEGVQDADEGIYAFHISETAATKGIK